MEDDLKNVLSSIPALAGLDMSQVAAERLGGLTNRNYLIACPSGRFVLRLAGEGTEQYIDRIREEKNASIAFRAGVNAEIIHFDNESGTMVTRFIENAVTLDIERLKDSEVLKRTGQAFKQLHDSPELFDGEFELFNQIDQYLEVIKVSAQIFRWLQRGTEECRSCAGGPRMHPLPRTACHCDPMVENCIDNGDRVFIIDFEYAGNNDPMWDLGDLSVEGHFLLNRIKSFLTLTLGMSRILLITGEWSCTKLCVTFFGPCGALCSMPTKPR